MQADCKKSVFNLIKGLDVLSVDKYNVLGIFNEVITRLQLNFIFDARAMDAVIGQDKSANILQELSIFETLESLVEQTFTSLLKQFEPIKPIAYEPGQLATYFA